MPVYHLSPTQELYELSEAPYLSEAELQELLARYPNLLAGSLIAPGQPRRWLLISREFGVPDGENSGNRWSLDHLFLDQDGVPTLVEVKRSTDTRLRREVIGQVLDYAANAVTYWSMDEMARLYRETCTAQAQDADEQLVLFLQNQREPEAFWQLVQTNLRAGKIRMLIVADIIPRELQRIIEFLNEQLQSAEILGVEIKQYVNGGLRTLAPRVVGMTTEAISVKKSGAASIATPWDEQTYLAAVHHSMEPVDADTMSRLMAWFKAESSQLLFGVGKQHGSYCPIRQTPQGKRFAFWVYSNGVVEVCFQYLANQPPFDQEEMRQMLFDRLNAIPGINLPADKLAKRPSFSVYALRDPENFRQFLDIAAWTWQTPKI